ncbi:TolC family protein [Ichthyenterobacterium sp. W332]|uniref:TolC family protein n=1 Tax=Microcosmobacter mediterraneus TaxID=3075607 RepID=A0ABU2YLK1_9FLAO|nr:TolC family protein [Ichthyenterobacterium sp. W332]MDT0559029.1 TolC family protein [Ichthyenterobacterium sp. W332]
MRHYLNIFIALCITAFSFGQINTYKIGFLLDKSSVEIEVLLKELSSEISAVVGEDAKLEFPETSKLVNNFDSAVALNNYNQLLQNSTDIIIAFGIVNNAVISKIGNYQKPTIVFGALSEELLVNEAPITSINNYTSITTSQSYTEDIKLLKKLANPKALGIVIEKAFTDNLPITETFEKIGSDLNLKMTIIPFESLADITSNLSDVDGVYLAGGFYLSDAEMKQLANVLIEKKLPSFTANPVKDVKNGILASNHDQSELNQFFRRIALTVEAVVNGEGLSGLSTKLESKSTLTVNYNTAEKIGLPLKYSLIATTSFVGNPKEIVTDKTYTLVSVMQEAIAKNLELQTIEKDISLTEKDVQLAKSDYLPNVTAGGTGSYVDPKLAEVSNGQSPEITTSGNVTLQQTIYSEAANANISIQKSLRDAQQENYNSEALNTVFNTATAYFTALILKTNLSIQNQNLELTKYNLKIATENYEAGQSGKSDVLRFKSEMAQNTQQMVEAINQLEQAYYVLNQLLNNPIDTKIDVEEAELQEGIFSNYNYEQLGQFLDDPTLRQPFVKFLIQEAMANAPELKALDYNLKATERSERLFGVGRFLPTVALQGQYNYEFSRSGAGSSFPANFPAFPDGYYSVGLNVSIPIFNQNKQHLNKQIASIQKEQLEISRDNIELSIEKNINDAVLDLVNQISNIQLSKVFEETAKEALDLTQTSYANGAVNIVQLLDAQNNYVQAQQASANATYNYLQSSMQLERSLGLFFLLQDESEGEAFIQRFLEFTQNND